MVDIKTIESWLWEAACSIRGSMDAPKYKDYILPLVFLKRLSDVYEDEIKKLGNEFGSIEAARKLVKKDKKLVRFYVPDESMWSEIRKASKNLGQVVTNATRALAKANSKLQGVVDVVDFNSTVSGQRILDDDKLSKLIEIISKHRLGLKDAEPDVLGRAYEYLLRKFAESQGQSAGEFYTPKEVGFLMAYILDPKQGQTVYDPACGSGGLLVKCELVLNEKEKKIDKPLQLYGQEMNHVTYAMAKMNMMIHDMEGQVAIGDTLRAPKFLDGNGLKKFDLVIANPMWNQDGYGPEFYEHDQFGRFEYGFLNKDSADWGWVQLMAASLNETGKAAVILDTGAVSRGSGNKGNHKEKVVRQAFVEKDWIEGVILLPDNLFYNTTAPGIILFINKAKSAHNKGKVVLVNASKYFEKSKESSKNYIPEQQMQTIVNEFKNAKDLDGLVKIVTNEELAQSDYNLSPSKFIDVSVKEGLRDIGELLKELKQLETEEKHTEKQLQEIFSKLGY